MEIFPSIDEVRLFAKENKYKVVPLSCEFPSAHLTPEQALSIAAKKSKHCFILDSAEDSQATGRFTFVGFDPRLSITSKDGKITVKDFHKGEYSEPSPNIAIKKVLSEYSAPKLERLPPFTGGLVGYFGYEYAKFTEPSVANNAVHEDSHFNELDLMLFDSIIAFDNSCGKVFIIVNISLENIDEEYSHGVAKIETIKELLINGESYVFPRAELKSEFSQMFEKDKYCEMIAKAKNYIYEGDIFQVVLSNRFEAEFQGSLFDTYKILRKTNPSPYMFYFSGTELEFAGASPETLVKLKDGELFTYPLAGTRKRGATSEEDEALERELLADQKELAEHNMLVDLGRNDLGKISTFGSVKVDKYMNILRFSHVMHIGSTVTGQIAPKYDGLDAICAVLPAGTLSGAPKIRAMQIIGELEGESRGIYGGAIGYLDFTGNMDTCIAIRLAYKKDGKVFVRSGAGIVADSDPESEYQECVNKAAAVISAIKAANEGKTV